MGPKAKKDKRNLCKKEVPAGPRTWPDLPQQLVNFIARHSSLIQNMSFGGLAKTWRASTRCYATEKSPWPQLLSDESRSPAHISRVFRIPFHTCWSRQDCWTCFTGWILPLRDPNIPFKFAALSSSPARRTNPNNPNPKPTLILLVLTGISSPAFVFCKIEGFKNSWIEQDSTLIDPYSSEKRLMQFSNCIGFKGKFYALSLQGTLAVIEDIDSRLTITALGSSRGVPSVTSRHFREYLAESDGEILLVFLICKKFIDIVDEVEVFRLKFPRLSWVKMESLGDRTLFVGANWCMSVTASKVGCRSNCIYLTHHGKVDWWIYDMKCNSMITDWNNADSAYKIPSLVEEMLI